MSELPPQIFDRLARQLRRDRTANGPGSPLELPIADELVERLSAVSRRFESALIINTGHGHLANALRARGIAVAETDHGARFAASAGGVLCDEDRLIVPPEEFDLVICPSCLDSVDDVPGALIAARHALSPGGMFLACLIGAPSLPMLRDAARAADMSLDRAVARFHPQIDVRSAGDLLVRAGFSLPVADAETLRVSYRSFDQLADDLRTTGLGNVLANRHGASKQWLARVRSAFFGHANHEERVIETVTLLVLTGWAKDARQT